ncbi:MAG: flagellar hook-basal body complex protein [Phycisphaeraceae bacterium]|nr:flagellar hook-basal body complex protein [Phycisphaeraceae bacterium]
MGLTTALYTAMTGLNANSGVINVAGNNIANTNTTGFKSSRADFETQLLMNVGNGSAPTAQSGGVNPTQIGLGVKFSGTTHNFNDGTINLTGINSDVAIEGNGFFVVDYGGNQKYTRAGNFGLDSDQNFVDANGGRVQGYSIDEEYNIVSGVVGNIEIPVGSLTIAEPTGNINFAGNLNSGGEVATLGTIVQSDALYADAGQVTQANANTLLQSLFNASGSPLFVDGDVLTVTDVTRGGAALPEKTFQIGAANTTESDAFGSTVQDLLTFYEDIMGIDTSVSGGATIVNGQINIEGHLGTVNELAITSDNMVLNKDTSPTLPFNFLQTQEADGESVRTTFIAYNSLGQEMTVDLNVVLESKSNAGSTWRFYVQSEDDSDLSRVLGNGTIKFDTNGRFLLATGTAITMDLEGTGALTPQSINLLFDEPADSLSALATNQSTIASTQQDGSSIGTLEDFFLTEDGVVHGIFSNSITRNLGQVVLANFVNQDGLVEEAGNLYDVTSASGTPILGAPGTSGTGRTIGQALELSNVDLSQEFITLINATTGYSANSRVFSTSDQLIQELLNTLT